MDGDIPGGRPDGARGIEALEVELLITGMAKQYGYDFAHYSRPWLTRRVRHAVKAEGVPTVSALQDKVLHDPECMSRLVAGISVHTTSMFRDADVYRAIRTEVIPMLRTYPFVR